MANLKEVFKALPHVKTVWVTKDGHFHLHSANGGERVDRDALDASPELITPIEPVMTGADDLPEQLHTRSKGRPKRT